jgi:hypothetical protein
MLTGCMCNMIFSMHIVCIENIMLHMQPVFPTFDPDHSRDSCKYSRLPTERAA